MKALSRIILLITLLFSLNACTHNNGDIGDLFGTWKLESITINGDVDTAYAEANNVLWKFQSSVMSMIRANDISHNKLETWASWSYANDETQLVLNFTHTDDDNKKPGSTKYSPLPETHLPKATISTLDITKLNGREMTLKYHSEDGTIFIYQFKKWC